MYILYILKWKYIPDSSSLSSTYCSWSHFKCPKLIRNWTILPFYRQLYHSPVWVSVKRGAKPNCRLTFFFYVYCQHLYQSIGPKKTKKTVFWDWKYNYNYLKALYYYSMLVSIKCCITYTYLLKATGMAPITPLNRCSGLT